jgi:hypothetical protein
MSDDRPPSRIGLVLLGAAIALLTLIAIALFLRAHAGD